jgi:transcriptional regulator with XRE-family HTH domain
MKILKNIKEIRESKGISQEYVASQLKIDVSNYSRLESGKHELKVGQLAIIAKTLGKREIDLFTHPLIYVEANQNESNTDVFVALKLKKELKETVLDLITQNNNLEILKN